MYPSSRLPTNIFKIIINSKFACKYMHIKINITKIWVPPVFDLYICGPQRRRPWPPRPVVSRSGSYSWVPPPRVLWGSSPGTASLQSSVSCHLHYISKKSNSKSLWQCNLITWHLESTENARLWLTKMMWKNVKESWQKLNWTHKRLFLKWYCLVCSKFSLMCFHRIYLGNILHRNYYEENFETVAHYLLNMKSNNFR